MNMSEDEYGCNPIAFTQLGDFRIKFKDDMIMFKNDHHVNLDVETNESFEGIRLMARLQGLQLIDVDDIHEQQGLLLLNKSEKEIKAMQQKWFPIQVFDYNQNCLITIQVRSILLSKTKISKSS